MEDVECPIQTYRHVGIKTHSKIANLMGVPNCTWKSHSPIHCHATAIASSIISPTTHEGAYSGIHTSQGGEALIPTCNSIFVRLTLAGCNGWNLWWTCIYSGLPYQPLDWTKNVIYDIKECSPQAGLPLYAPSEVVGRLSIQQEDNESGGGM